MRSRIGAGQDDFRVSSGCVGIELRPHRARLARSGARSRCGSHRIATRALFAGPVPRRSAVRCPAHDAADRPGCVAVCRRRCARAGWGHFGSRGRCVSGMAFPGGAVRQPADGTRLGRMASGVAFRTVSEWRECFSRHGLEVQGAPADAGTPFANYLFRLTARQAESAATVPT